jgi:polyhydroxybutyrate depolymerase
MKRHRALAAALILIALPAVWVAIDAVVFHARNRNNGSLVSSGEKRHYILYVPRSYDRAKPAPLVISMHGAGAWPAHQRGVSLWNRVADEEGFLVVYPSGSERGGPRVWKEKDVRFIADLIDELQATHNIDPSRIYANGLSNGGGMSFVLSCTLSDRIAAVGLVAAAQTVPWTWCTDRRAVPMIAFHGTADRATPYDGGLTWAWSRPFPNIATWTANWARRNRCAPTPIETAVAADVTRREYAQCATNASVVLYTIRGGGHTWPGGGRMPEWFVGRTSNSVDATRVMWEFFRAHPLGGR